MRVLFSFPHKIGADRICYTAWQQVQGLVAAGVDVLVMPAAVERPVSAKTLPTLAKGKFRIPFKLIGKYRAFHLHDQIVASRLKKLAGEIDVIHVWPCGALETIKTAKKLGIPTVLERPNAHTRYAYEVVKAECQRIGVKLPPGDDYTYRTDVLAHEEAEFRTADYLLCPSEFVAKTFRDKGFPSEKILRHAYGFDEAAHFPDIATPHQKFTVLFAGVAAVRKGLHLALEAWMQSPALRENGLFLIAGEIAPDYRKHIESALADKSVNALGYRRDVPNLMRQADALVLPTFEEGFPLVVAEAVGSGCVPVVSEVCTDVCKHMQNALVHPIGDVPTLRQHLTLLYEDRVLLQKLREGCIRHRLDFTWGAAGRKLAAAYEIAIAGPGRESPLPLSREMTSKSFGQNQI